MDKALLRVFIHLFFFGFNNLPQLLNGLPDIFKAVIELGGTLSGEHGIGIAKRPYMHLAMQEKNLDLMRGIKKVFDPKGILNPEKIF